MTGEEKTLDVVSLDKAHLWHPFTQQLDWCAPEFEPLVLVSGEGALLKDDRGRQYIDGNSSIWTNIHGHRHPRIDAAIRVQLDRVAHTSFLGFTHPLAAELARELIALWPGGKSGIRDASIAIIASPIPDLTPQPVVEAPEYDGSLSRVFFSDNGSTAIEVALKMAAQFWQQIGEADRREFVAFSGAYHGDTMGASSLGGIPVFHGRFAAWQFPARRVTSMAELQALDSASIAGVVIEPLIQGAAGMRLWPKGMLSELRRWCDDRGVLLILDEVMTGFGRTGTMFACQKEGVIPDFIALAKGLTGGYLPLAATLTTERVFSAFLGGADRTLYYGHSYTANALGCAAALASLAIFREERVLESLQGKIALLSRLLEDLRSHPRVMEIRQCGFIAGIEVGAGPGQPFEAAQLMGVKICLAARWHGLLTRPIRDTIALMLPYCVSDAQIRHAVDAIAKAIDETSPVH